MYVLCLIDWETKNLKSDEYKNITEEIMGSQPKTIGNWAIKELDMKNQNNLSNRILSAELGFYHSRFIFKFELESPFNKISDIRDFREAIQSKINEYCNKKKIIEIIKKYRKGLKKPHIFCYSVFELDGKSDFWKSEKRPFSMETTCFYTELEDSSSWRRIILGLIGRNRVKMRISGPKIISTPMTKWFFNNIVNLVFHEALYPLSRDKNILKNEDIHYGLEQRLEIFASALLKDFHSYSSVHLKHNLQNIAFILSLIGGIIGIISFVLYFF